MTAPLIKVRAFVPLLIAAALGVAPAAPEDHLADLLDPARWSSENFMALWRKSPLEDTAPVSRAYPAGSTDPFGLAAQAVCARIVRGGIHSISIVVLDAGTFFGFGNSNLPKGESFESGKARFDQEFTVQKQALITKLKLRGSSSAIQLGTRSGLKLKATVQSAGGAFVRLLSYEHQLLAADIFRNEADARSLHCLDAAATKTAPTAASSNPEHRLPVVPMVPQGNRGYCGVAILAMVGQWLGLQPGAEEYAAINGFLYGQDRNPDIRELFGAVAREAGVKAQRSPKLDVARMRQSLDQGMPVVVFRWWSQERDYLHSAYSAHIARGEKAELPTPGMEDRRTWPQKNGAAHASIINGYRDDRHEIIFTESWGQAARNRRMRGEEMEATSYYAVYYAR